MKKLLLLAAMTALLTGCSSGSSETFLRSLLDSDSQLSDDADYSEYKQLEEDSLLDENGQYISGDITEDTSLPPVHTTFASNSLISIDYFTDPELTIPVEMPCRLSPGDTIYASEPVLSSYCDPLYRFEEFVLIDHSRKEPVELCTVNGLEIQIPEDFSGSEISVEPRGGYGSRNLHFSSHLTGEPASKSLGVWYIGDKLVVNGSENVNGSDSLKVRFSFDPKEFYIVGILPKPDTGSDESGSVMFSVTPGSPAEINYDIELHHFITAHIQDSDGRMNVKLNGVNYQFSADSSSNMAGLRTGDIITLDVAEDYAVDSTQLMVGEPQQISGGWRYNITVGENSGDSVNVSVFRADNDQMAVYRAPDVKNCTASLAFSDGGYPVKPGDRVDKSQKVTLTLTPDSGYYFKSAKTGEPLVQTMDFAGYIRNIDSILLENPAKKLITVNFDDSPDNHGDVTFKLDENVVSGETILREDQKLTIQYDLYDTEYEIARNTDSILGKVYNFFDSHFDSLGHMDNVEFDIPITPDLDGRTITRQDYIGLNIKGD